MQYSGGVQYGGGCSVQWRDTVEVLMGRATPDNVCAVQWGVCSTVEDVQCSGGIPLVQLRDIISTVEDVQYSKGISSVRWRDIISTVEDVQLQWRNSGNSGF